MKKYILYMLSAFVAVTLAGCEADEGTNPGGDPAPAVTIYNYAPAEGNPDEDFDVRIVPNNKTEEVYTLIELVADKEAYVKANGEAKYIAKVKSEGVKCVFDKSGVCDQSYTGKAGTYALTAVAVSGNKVTATEFTFYGLSWTTVATGKYNYGVLAQIFAEPAAATLQVCDSDPTLYRIKDAFGAGAHVKFVTLPETAGEDDYGKYYWCRVEGQSTGIDLGGGVIIYCRDIGYWQGNPAYVLGNGFENYLYYDGDAKNCVDLCLQYYAGSSNFGYNYDSFVADAE